MGVPAAVSLITLGVADVEASTRFYSDLGFELSSASVPGEVSFFRTAGGLLALWGAQELAEDAAVRADTVPADTVPADTVPADTVPADTVRADTVPADTVPADAVAGHRGVSLAVNVASESAVDDALAHAQASGARITRGARKVDWGGYNGYFADPDGHLWEVAYNPFWPLDDRGLPILP
jgi:uncharacterized protein